MADDNPPANIAADFYEELDYGGARTSYTIHQTQNLQPKNIAELYKSVKVGTVVQVLCWNEPDTDGNYAFVRGKQPDLSKLPNGLAYNSLSIEDPDVHIFKFKFIDATGGNPRDYSLIVQVHDLGKRVLYSNDGDSYKIAGKISASGGVTTIAVSVHNDKTGVDIAAGSIYFRWDNPEARVEIESDADWPPQLEHKQDGHSTFQIVLRSNEPSG
ncbi:membrane binding-domain-containing protein [Xylaria cf. heliscus]|nr:membrane binding-domain-containing protein [Xylaria cf. heliscus]